MEIPVDLLLADAFAFDGQYRKGLSNHLPMAMIALSRLGAGRSRIVEFRERYVKRLESAPVGGTPLSRAELSRHLGTHARYAELAELFRTLVQEREPHEVVRDALRVLLPGLAGGAFHGLIRLGYAVSTLSVPREEVAAALAYMADVHLPLGAGEPSAGAGTAPASLESLMARAASDPAATGYVGKHGLIFDDLADVAVRPQFAPLLDAASLGPRTLEEAARAALVLYASTANFTALHCVTATHALRMIAPLSSDMELATRVLCRALLTAYVTIAAPKLADAAACDRMRARAVPGWDAIAEAACASDDEHVIKIVWTSREEHGMYGDPLYPFVAARAAGLVPKDA